MDYRGGSGTLLKIYGENFAPNDDVIAQELSAWLPRDIVAESSVVL
jgi:hypothetical protein